MSGDLWLGLGPTGANWSDWDRLTGCQCQLPVSAFFCLPIANCRGAQGAWLQKYRGLPKVASSLQSGEPCMANLLQNPSKMPVAGTFAPTLLRNGKMWLLFPAKTDWRECEERYMLGSEHLLLMGVPVWPQFAANCSYPHIGCMESLTAGAQRSLAGNEPWFVGGRWALGTGHWSLHFGHCLYLYTVHIL